MWHDILMVLIGLIIGLLLESLLLEINEKILKRKSSYYRGNVKRLNDAMVNNQGRNQIKNN